MVHLFIRMLKDKAKDSTSKAAQAIRRMSRRGHSAMSAVTPELFDILVALPLAQAAFGAVLGAVASATTAKQCSTLVTAAARGAAQGAAASASGDAIGGAGEHGLLDIVELVLLEVAKLAGVKTQIGVSRAKSILRELGAQDLASALGRASRQKLSGAP